jgi:hypothetical protein
VDFEPFQDGEFVDSELGQSDGLRLEPLVSHGEFVGGATPSKDKEKTLLQRKRNCMITQKIYRLGNTNLLNMEAGYYRAWI